MFEQVDALPRAQRHASMFDRYGKLHLGEGRAQMRGHVVGSFGVVFVAGEVFGRERAEVGFQIASHRWIGILLNEERRGGVTAKQRQDAGLDGRFMNKLTHVRGEFNNPHVGALTCKWRMAWCIESTPAWPVFEV